MRRGVVVVVCLLAVASRAWGAALETSEEIQECVRHNQTHSAAKGTVAFHTLDRVGSSSESRADVYWKRGDDGLSRIRLSFSDPPDLRGSALLLIEKRDHNDMFLYLPALQKVRRVTGRMVTGSLFGTDFSYEQFERMLGLAEDSSSQRLADASEQERPVLVLESRPSGEESQFEKLVSYVDRETCVPLRVDFFEGHDELRKRLAVDFAKVEKKGDVWIPLKMRMDDLRDGTHTTFVVEEMELNVDIPRGIFSEKSLQKGR